jgi:hypothetical protein
MDIESFVKNIYKNPSKDLEIILSKSIDILLSEVKSGNIVVAKSIEDALVRITNDTELKWRKLSRKLHFRCSSCNSLLYPSECGRYECKVCDNVMSVKIPQLNKICNTCVSYKLSCLGNLDKTYPSVKVYSVSSKKEIKWINKP